MISAARKRDESVLLLVDVTRPGALALTIMVELAVLGDGVPDALTVMPGELC